MDGQRMGLIPRCNLALCCIFLFLRLSDFYMLWISRMWKLKQSELMKMKGMNVVKSLRLSVHWRYWPCYLNCVHKKEAIFFLFNIMSIVSYSSESKVVFLFFSFPHTNSFLGYAKGWAVLCCAYWHLIGT